MQWFKEVDGGNPDGTAKDRVGLTAGTTYLAKYWNDNFFNIFNVVTNAGYTLIDDNLEQLTKALKGKYQATYTYNTSSIATQSVSDVVLGSDGKYYTVQTNGVIGDNPVGSVTGNWALATFDANSVNLTSNQTIAGTKTFSGTVALPSTTSIGTITSTELSYIDGVTSSVQTQLDAKAPLASPALTGTPTAPTPTAGDNTTKVATTAFVQTANGGAWVANDSRAKTALNAGGTAPIYACRAWVNFNGTGTVAIRASGNVSSITDNGVGDYTVNFTTAMPDANYSSSSIVSSDSVYSTATILTSMTTSSYRFSTVTLQTGNSAVDRSIVHFNAFR